MSSFNAKNALNLISAGSLPQTVTPLRKLKALPHILQLDLGPICKERKGETGGNKRRGKRKEEGREKVVGREG